MTTAVLWIKSNLLKLEVLEREAKSVYKQKVSVDPNLSQIAIAV